MFSKIQILIRLFHAEVGKDKRTFESLQLWVILRCVSNNFPLRNPLKSNEIVSWLVGDRSMRMRYSWAIAALSVTTLDYDPSCNITSDALVPVYRHAAICLWSVPNSGTWNAHVQNELLDSGKTIFRAGRLLLIFCTKKIFFSSTNTIL